jgi:hypothetical protein
MQQITSGETHTYILETIKQHSLNGRLEFCCEENGSV